MSCRRETNDGQRAKVMRTEPRLQAAGQGFVHEQRVEVHRRLRHADTLLTC